MGYDDNDDNDDLDLSASIDAHAHKLTMDEFGAMMDTLALQPVQEESTGELIDGAVPPMNLTLKPLATHSALLRNHTNGIG